jgi:hypothetical protein
MISTPEGTNDRVVNGSFELLRIDEGIVLPARVLQGAVRSSKRQLLTIRFHGNMRQGA